MLKKSSQIFLNLVIWGGTCLGLALPVMAQDSSSSNIAMWKVESPSNTLYLLGSIHVGKDCELNSPRITTAMEEAEHTVFELDFTKISAADQIKLGMDLAQVGRLDAGDRTLKESVSPETYEQIRQTYDELKPAALKSLSLDTVNTIYRPTFIMMQMQGFQTQKLGLTGECGVDKLLINRAQAKQKNIIALETLEQQSQLIQMVLRSIPERDIETEFEQILASQKTNQVNSLLSSVMTGKLDSVEKAVNESCKPTPTICYKMLDERNIAWMNQIKTYLTDDEDYFVIVGAAHMIGPNSLIELLKQGNYTVEPF